MKIKNIAAVLVLGAGFSAMHSVNAETVLSENKSETVIVTATRTAQTADETLSSVSVITQEDIERQNATSIQEVLRSAAGISVTNSGGEGKLSSVFIRGTESDHVLVLVDGVKVGSVTAGSSPFQLIPIELVERIEIVRGPRSSLYGSEAIGGVIQIFTKKGEDSFRPSVSLSAGTYKTRKVVTSFAGGNDRSWLNVSISSYETDGFNACNGDPLLGGCYADEPDDDSYKYISGSFSAGYRLAQHTRIDVNWMRSDAQVNYDGFYNRSDTAQEVAGAKLSHDVSSNWSVSLMAGQSKDESDDFSDDVFQNRIDTSRESVAIQNDILLNNSGELTIGLDYMEDRVDSTTIYDETLRTNKGLFAQYIHDFGKQNLQASGRRDDNQQFGIQKTGSLAWGMELNRKMRVMASYGTAFKAPTFNDLYYPMAGNRDLKPEESASIEIGLQSREHWGHWAVSLYRTNIDDLIVYDFVASMPINIEEALVKGVEFTVQSNILNWDAQFNVALLNAKNQSDNGNDGNDLPRRPRKSARIIISRDYGKYNLGVTVIADGKRYDDAANTMQLDSYYTADISAGYQINRNWKAIASAKNIFDEEYETVAYYNNSGRNYLVTVSYRPH